MERDVRREGKKSDRASEPSLEIHTKRPFGILAPSCAALRVEFLQHFPTSSSVTRRKLRLGGNEERRFLLVATAAGGVLVVAATKRSSGGGGGAATLPAASIGKSESCCQ